MHALAGLENDVAHASTMLIKSAVVKHMHLMPNSHRLPDTTKRSCLCRVGRCELSLETVRLKPEQLADRPPSSRGV